MLRALFAEDALGEIAVGSSFGTESAVLLHLVAKADAAIPVIFVDTLRMFPETLAYRDTLIEAFGIKNATIVTPDAAVLAEKDENELRWSFDPVGCCAIRKVEPLARALESYDAWITGRRMDQSDARKDLNIVEEDPVHPGRIKINPLIHWTQADLWYYVEENKVPHNRLYDEGYLSIGCACCTRPCKEGDDERAGRWWWENPEHKECGLHLNYKQGGGI